MADNSHTRLTRKKALSMDEVVSMYIKSMKISSGMNTQCIFSAWDDASGAARFTLKKFFRDGRLYVTLSSSVVRNQLSFQKDALIEKMNGILAENELFSKDDPRVTFVKELILK